MYVVKSRKKAGFHWRSYGIPLILGLFFTTFACNRLGSGSIIQKPFDSSSEEKNIEAYLNRIYNLYNLLDTLHDWWNKIYASANIGSLAIDYWKSGLISI